MKTRIALLALSLAVLPLAVSQSALADGYYNRDQARIARDNYRIGREKADIAHDWRAIARERRERNYYAARERQAARRGNYWAAGRFDWLRRHEQYEINAERRDIAKDRNRLARYRYGRAVDVARRNYDEGRYR